MLNTRYENMIKIVIDKASRVLLACNTVNVSRRKENRLKIELTSRYIY